MKIFLDKTSKLKTANIKEINSLVFNLWRYFENKTVQGKAVKPKVNSKVTRISSTVSRFIYREQSGTFSCSFVMENKESFLFESSGINNITVCTSDSDSKLKYEAPGTFSIINDCVYYKPDRTDVSEKYYVYISGEVK